MIFFYIFFSKIDVSTFKNLRPIIMIVWFSEHNLFLVGITMQLQLMNSEHFPQRTPLKSFCLFIFRTLLLQTRSVIGKIGLSSVENCFFFIIYNKTCLIPFSEQFENMIPGVSTRPYHTLPRILFSNFVFKIGGKSARESHTG